MFDAALYKMLVSLHLAGKVHAGKPMLFFNEQTITPETVNYPQRVFRTGERINYLVLNPKGFKNDYIRVQIVKKEEKTPHWGYTVYWAKDYHIDTSDNYYINYIVLNEPGYYFMQVFSFDNFDKPIIRNDFWVK